MDRQFYLDLAAHGLRMPIGTDLILHERPDPAAAALDGGQLGDVIVETAQRFGTPLAFPLMDLRIEKDWLLLDAQIAAQDTEGWHYPTGPGPADLEQCQRLVETGAPTPRMAASLEALARVAAQPDLLPVGMCIGPFSLMTKLLSDPITGVYLAAIEPDDESAQATLTALEMAGLLVAKWAALQVAAGAKALVICEPACSISFISPHQMAADGDLLDRLVLNNLRAVKEALSAGGADLILHDCGQLNETIIRSFAPLDPAILSLGSPTDLPVAAPFVPAETVIYGNLPSKSFYSDASITVDQVIEMTQALASDLAATGHPFIIGTECDVLAVPGAHERIMAKVQAMINA